MMEAAQALSLDRAVPMGATITVRAGEAVSPDTVIAIGHLERRLLRLPPGDNFELLKKPGDQIKKGEAVAIREEAFGLGLRELVSPCDGFVESINPRRTGLVVTGGDSRIRALAPGEVVAVEPEKVRLKVHGRRLQGFFGLGQPVFGQLWAIGDLYLASEVKRRLGPEVKDRIIVADSFVLPEVLPLLARQGAAGLVCGGLDFGPLWELVAPSGPFPAGHGLPTLLVMGGFGAARIAPDDQVLLREAAGQQVYASGPAAGRFALTGSSPAELIIASPPRALSRSGTTSSTRRLS